MNCRKPAARLVFITIGSLLTAGTTMVDAGGSFTPNRFGIVASQDANSAGALLFTENCSVCHMIPTAYRGIYGTDQQSVEWTIRSGGNNVTGMPAFGELLTDDEISELAKFIRTLNGWE